jgi:hypothetical protein
MDGTEPYERAPPPLGSARPAARPADCGADIAAAQALPYRVFHREISTHPSARRRVMP